MGSGYYTAPSHTPELSDLSEEQVFAEIVRDIETGVGDSGIKAGIVGEIGCSWPLDPTERKILRAAALTRRPVHVKKGQFMSPWNMKNSVRKLESSGCEQILLADRGTFMGYNMLVNDMTSFPIMARTGYPVSFDATHSIQMPTSMGNVSGGQREYIPYLVRAAVGCGVHALFMETHDDPANALSDANTVLDIKYLRNVLSQAKIMHETRLQILDKFGEDQIHVDD